MNALYNARQNYIVAESSEKIRRAFGYNVHVYANVVKFITAEKILNYGKVTHGADGQFVPVHHRKSLLSCSSMSSDESSR